ncbi:MAG TPA: hypothetical protein DHV62_05310 [Elusimicrobia bacterium]|jgi:hypothetical protein|nr:hypothetical protein [Elusimicrobiota bacterium]
MNIPAKIFVRIGKLIIQLPLTNPTGKIRVKRRGKGTNYGLPIATRVESFTKDDYVEWQISYATQNPPEESKVKDIVINNVQIGFELTKLLYESIKLNIFSKNDIFEIEKFVDNVQSTETLEENEKILREDNLQEIKGGFKKFVEKTPLFIKKNKEKGYFVEIILQHKQRAVGIQAMVYLCIYVEKLQDKNGKSLIGRAAESKEFGEFEIISKNKEIVTDVIKAFAVASTQHKNDILDILKQVKKKCNL